MSLPPKNILFLFTDQFRADCVGALGNEQIRTPRIDQLVREGTAFTRCFTPSPVCVAARHALTSGVAPHLTGCVDNFDVPCQRPSFMQALAAGGYQTHGVGKMHFIKSKGDWGFETRDVSEELKGCADRDDFRAYLDANGYSHVADPHGLRSEFYYLPQPSQLPDQLHNNSWVADRSIDFLETRDKSRPFMLWSSFIKPHPPFESPNPWSRLYRMHEMGEPHRPEGYQDRHCFWNKVQNRYKYRDGGYDRHIARMIKAAYYGTISHVDHHLGRILDALGPEIDNTLVVFSADHGEMLGDFGCYGKRSMHDASVRVPLLARLPGVFPAGQTCAHAANLLDLYPTFLETAGIESHSPEREGVSLAALAQNGQQDRVTFSQFSQNGLALYMAADAKWKYTYSAPDQREWLDGVGQETQNLASEPERQQILRRLRSLCIKRLEKAGSNAVANGQWTPFPAPRFPENPDDGLLFQDPPGLYEAIQNLGPHARQGIDRGDKRYNLLDSLSSANE